MGKCNCELYHVNIRRTEERGLRAYSRTTRAYKREQRRREMPHYFYNTVPNSAYNYYNHMRTFNYWH